VTAPPEPSAPSASRAALVGPFGTARMPAVPAAPFAPVATPPSAPGALPLGALQTPAPPNYSGFEPVPAPRSSRPAPLLIDVTPLTLAVETVNGFCDPVIERNTQVPCERTRVFVTAVDNQSLVRVRISQGESSRFGENTLLGEVELSGLSPAPRGETQIAVSFSLDTNGMLSVSAKDIATNRATSTQVRLIALPDASDIAWMMQRNAARQ
jgi:molecular chaperone DnaK